MINMVDKEIIILINEEISNFDFLNNQTILKEEEYELMLKNEKFQSKFIIDSISNKKEKIKFSVSNAHIDDSWMKTDIDDSNKFNIEFSIDLEYRYNDDYIKFSLFFYGDKINFTIGGTEDSGSYETESNRDVWYQNISWHDINVKLYSVDGAEINFIALDKAPGKIYELFVRSYLEDLIEKSTIPMKMI